MHTNPRPTTHRLEHDNSVNNFARSCEVEKLSVELGGFVHVSSVNHDAVKNRIHVELLCENSDTKLKAQKNGEHFCPPSTLKLEL